MSTSTRRRFVRDAHGRSYVIELYRYRSAWRWRVEDYPNLIGLDVTNIGRGYIGQGGETVETRGGYARHRRLFDGELPDLVEQLREIVRGHYQWVTEKAKERRRQTRREVAA